VDEANEVLIAFFTKAVKPLPSLYKLITNGIIFLLKALMNAEPISEEKKKIKMEEKKREKEEKKREREEKRKEKEGEKKAKADEDEDEDEAMKKKGKGKKGEGNGAASVVLFPVIHNDRHPPLEYGALDIPKVKGALNYFIHQTFTSSHSIHLSFFDQLIARAPAACWLVISQVIAIGKKSRNIFWRNHALVLMHKLLAATPREMAKTATTPFATVLLLHSLPVFVAFTKSARVFSSATRLVKDLQREHQFIEELKRSPVFKEKLSGVLKQNVDQKTKRALFLLVASVWGGASAFPELNEYELPKEERLKLKRQRRDQRRKKRALEKGEDEDEGDSEEDDEIPKKKKGKYESQGQQGNDFDDLENQDDDDDVEGAVFSEDEEE
jgi:hypothetical protein